MLGIGLASLLGDLGKEAVTSVLPAYLAALGASAGVLGSVEGGADALAALAKLGGGWLADRLGRLKTLVVSTYAATAAAPLVMASAAFWPLVAAGRGLAWVARGVRSPSRKVLLASAAEPKAYGKAFGLERAMDTCGAVAAPLLVLALLRAGWSLRGILVLSALPALGAGLAVWFLVREAPRRTRASTAAALDPEAARGRAGWSGFPAPFRRFLAGVGLFGLGDFADTFYILYAVRTLAPRLGAPRAAALAVGFYALHNAAGAACSALAGAWADRGRPAPILALGYACTAAAALGMALGAAATPAVAAVFVLGGLGVGLSEAVEDARAAALLPEGRKGRGFGLLAAVSGTGDWASSVGVGWLWAWLGPGPAFGAAAGVMLAGAAAMLAP